MLLDKNKQEIKEQLAQPAGRRYGPDDRFLLWFSMHGHFDEAGEAGFLCPAGVRRQDPSFDTWLLHAELSTLVTRVPCEHILLVVAPCYSNTLGGRENNAPVPDWKHPDCRTTIVNALRHKTRYYIASGDKETPAWSQLAERMRISLGGRYFGNDGILSLKELLGVLS